MEPCSCAVLRGNTLQPARNVSSVMELMRRAVPEGRAGPGGHGGSLPGRAGLEPPAAAACFSGENGSQPHALALLQIHRRRGAEPGRARERRPAVGTFE
ncbi:hypothetical protein AAFF_G00016090 [Aldrovandia affinis]|uniref:Uncharacterized protein n=1 Tax=Aldrovandia affinis TaxID=143900 RepID=A0AAD7S674_9TELE|nr:hypothetical protein AAFF_G00016090 [Aldrovandia affinis]